MKRKFIGWSKKQQLMKVIDPATDAIISHVWVKFWAFFLFWTVVYKAPIKGRETIVDVDESGRRRYERTTLILPVILILTFLIPGCTQNNFYGEYSDTQPTAAEVCYICTCNCP